MRPTQQARAATLLTVPQLFEKQARIRGDKIACTMGDTRMSYQELNTRATRLANALLAQGVHYGDRIALLSENAPVFAEVLLAASKIGAIVATQNWRLSGAELTHCLDLVDPALCLVSSQFRSNYDDATQGRFKTIDLDTDYAALVQSGAATPLTTPIDPEDGLLIVYTSGTTGLPKAALISHRALIARAQQYCTEFGIDPDDLFYAYSPMFHIASADLVLATLMIGGSVVISGGLDPALLRELLATRKLSNLIFFPGMVDQVLSELAKMDRPVRGLKKFGALADLFPPHQIAAMTQAVNTPFCNTFASTETGMMPACGGRIPIGEEPDSFAKTESNFCLVRLVDDAGGDVADGETGELICRGPTLFSGYWRNEAATEEAFAGGWYHTGDLFRRNPDGTLDYVDRKKYLVKSGGENIYPAEIERVVMQRPEIDEALVVRRADATWGEVPVLVATRNTETLTGEALQNHCRETMARYKCPKAVFFVPAAFWPRNNTGKILRREVEEWVKAQG